MTFEVDEPPVTWVQPQFGGPLQPPPDTLIPMLPGYDLADLPTPPDDDATVAPCPKQPNRSHDDHGWVLIYPDGRRRLLHCTGGT